LKTMMHAGSDGSLDAVRRDATYAFNESKPLSLLLYLACFNKRFIFSPVQRVLSSWVFGG